MSTTPASPLALLHSRTLSRDERRAQSARLRVCDLQAEARRLGLRGWSRLRKDALIERVLDGIDAARAMRRCWTIEVAPMRFREGWGLAFELAQVVAPDFAAAPSADPVWQARFRGSYGCSDEAECGGEGAWGWRLVRECWAEGPAETREVERFTFIPRGLGPDVALELVFRREGAVSVDLASCAVDLTLSVTYQPRAAARVERLRERMGDGLNAYGDTSTT